jgi:WD40 repeat protein
LFVSQDINAKPNEFQRSFDFNSMKLNVNSLNFSPPVENFGKGISQVSETELSLPKGKKIQNIDSEDGRILDFQASREGEVIVASDYSLRMFDRNGAFQKEFVGHVGGVRAVAISQDGRYLASGGEDQTIVLWKLSETGAAPTMRQHPEFSDAAWGAYFESLPIDSLTRR